MNNKILQLDLVEEKKKLILQIEKLKKDLDAVNRLLEKYENDESKILYTDGLIHETKKLSDAVWEFFENDHNKRWKSSDMIKTMKTLRDEGKIETKTKDLPMSVRTIIKKLIEKNLVEKIPVLGGNRYKRKI